MLYESTEAYQRRMVMGHMCAAKLLEAQSALYALWGEATNWDNQEFLYTTTITAYDALQEAIQQIQRGLSVAHYG